MKVSPTTKLKHRYLAVSPPPCGQLRLVPNIRLESLTVITLSTTDYDDFERIHGTGVCGGRLTGPQAYSWELALTNVPTGWLSRTHGCYWASRHLLASALHESSFRRESAKKVH
jgi:hypothetical protein